MLRIMKLKGEMKMKELTYKQMGDYQIPEVALPITKELTQGKFSRMREKYLKEHKKGLYEELMIDGKMEQHLGEIEMTAKSRIKQIIESLALKNKVNEELKQKDQMKWVGLMNNISNCANEIVLKECIFND